ncbi:hypothetical protein Tco_0073060 [Tanacetum coccineum]
MPGPEHPPSPDYVPSPKEPEQAPLSPNYVPEPEYPEYLVPSDDEVPIEDQPLLADASPTALSPVYVVDSDPSEEDPEENPIEYPADRGDDDDDDYDYEDNDEEDKEEEEHLALADSTILPSIDHTPMTTATEALILTVVAALPLSSPPPSPLTSLSYPLPYIPSPPLPLPSPPTHTRPTYTDTPLGYKATMIRSRVASPSTHHLLEIPSPPLFEVEESLSAAAARQTGHTLAHRGRASTTLEELSRRVTNLVATLARDTHEMAVHAELLAYRAEVRALYEQISVLKRQIPQGHDKTREPKPTRDLEPQDGPADAGSSC